MRKSKGELDHNVNPDPFNDGCKNGGIVRVVSSCLRCPSTNGSQIEDKYINEEYRVDDNTTLYGVDALLAKAMDPFKRALADDMKKGIGMEGKGWQMLMKFDHLSTRAFLLSEMKYPWEVVQWMETRDTSTGAYDLAFAEVSMALFFNPIHYILIVGSLFSTP